MAISGTTEWDVRVSGSDSSGGSFDPTLGGTDYSQQDTPQVTYTDLAIGATTTQLTSSANPFTSAHVGNVINITGGTGFTTGRYQVASVASNVATMDRSVGTAASTGGTGNLGGALANVATAIASFGNAGNTVHVKAGTYTYTSNQSWTPTNFGFNAFSIIGYGTAHLDGGTKPLITTATNSTNLISIGAVNNGVLLFSNLSFSNTAGTKGTGVSATSGLSPIAYFVDCVFDGFSTAIAYTGSQFTQITLFRCEVKNCTTGIQQTSPLQIIDSYLHHNGWAVLSSITMATTFWPPPEAYSPQIRTAASR